MSFLTFYRLSGFHHVLVIPSLFYWNYDYPIDSSMSVPGYLNISLDDNCDFPFMIKITCFQYINILKCSLSCERNIQIPMY